MPSTVMQIKKTIPTLNTDSKGQNSRKKFTRRREIQPKSKNASNKKTTARLIDYLLIFSKHHGSKYGNYSLLACQSVSPPLWSRYCILTIGWINRKFHTDIHVPQRMKRNYSDALTFPVNYLNIY